jgi:Protein of unknown function (DUF1579)
MRPTTLLTLLIAVCALASVALAQTSSVAPKAPTTASSPATTTNTTTTAASSPATSAASMAPTAEEMKQMMELSKLNENHKLLATTAGTWNYTVKMWMDPTGKPTESTGTAIRKTIMDGRYVSGEYSGKFKMPGPDGKLQETNFTGMSMDGYDNVKKKFVSGWVDSMGTGIMTMDGTYDAATKTFTYTGDYEMMPGMKEKFRQVIKMTDATHMVMEYYEDRGQGETKTMEISYTKK